MRTIPPDHRSDTAHQPSPFELVAAIARRSSDGLLALAAGGGLVIVAVVLAAEPEWWRYALPAVTLACFGGWGILDRTAAERRATGATSPFADGALDAARLVVTLLGWGSLVGFLALVLWRPLGGVVH